MFVDNNWVYMTKIEILVTSWSRIYW